MCLVAIAWRAHPRYPLIVAGNRDEFHERATAAAAWWDDAPQVLGGRDLVAGGTWLAVSRAGKVAVVINDPRRPPGPERTASRGALVRDYVASDRPSGRFLDAVAVNEFRYAGFCLLLGTRAHMRGFVAPGDGSPRRWTIGAGVSVFSNSPISAPSPKVGWLGDVARRALEGADPDPSVLFEALARREPVAGATDDAHPAGATPFILGDRYGTRASTLVVVDADGRCTFEERRFAAGGAAAGTTREEFRLEG